MGRKLDTFLKSTISGLFRYCFVAGAVHEPGMTNLAKFLAILYHSILSMIHAGIDPVFDGQLWM